jgi:hypothetical protein
MPVSVLVQRDFAAWADCLDLITDSGASDPIRSRSCAMERHVEDNRRSRDVEGTDRITTIDDSAAGLGHSQHQILTWHIAKIVEAWSRQDDAPKGGGEWSCLNHFEMPE